LKVYQRNLTHYIAANWLALDSLSVFTQHFNFSTPQLQGFP
jgi:hypothetical protein